AVGKSAAESAVIYSCGNLPQESATNGPLTVEQALDKLLDDANELLGAIKKKEVDASKNAYDTYHATFAANEDAIKAKSADTQKELEDAMHEVNDALNASDF